MLRCYKGTRKRLGQPHHKTQWPKLHSQPSLGLTKQYPEPDTTTDCKLTRSVYPYIDPNQYVIPQAFKGKVVLVTGASRGIGQETALQYARAGASLDAILKEVPGAEIVTFTADVKDPIKAEEAVKVATNRFGRLDVVIANAGVATSFDNALVAKNPSDWWDTLEVNVRGVYNYLRAATPAILETKGSIIVITSAMAHLRIPHSSDYSISKFTLGRLVEFAALEYPELRIFAIHPGLIQTALAQGAGILNSTLPVDTPALPAATILALSAGKAEWLRGRYWSSNWDLGEGESKWKEKTLKQNGLVNKLFIPV
ncbi:NAD-P-binding protein [Multifurca ochricompacta]|uniref:NAD-P-binding protein n=1 Tax=Multifurca ochricompacta TaxID=376703 RepID=A0AAD4LXB6_9AGAM|nr:NAD-P-binding protein [Multifurca ochricompacta]